MRKIISLSVFLFVLLNILSTVSASWQTSELIMTAHVNLGNSGCIPLGCDSTYVFFYIPLGMDKPQYIKYIIYPECFGNPPNETEDWGIQMWCTDGLNKTIDLKQAMCEPTNGITVWDELKANTTGYFFWNNVQYEEYWCAFRRAYNSTDRVPVEFGFVVDSLGLSSPAEETVFTRQVDTGSSIISGIGELFTINFNIFQIGFYLLGAIIVIIGFVAVIGFIPLLLKWIMKRVSR